jgi:hypothetical protein
MLAMINDDILIKVSRLRGHKYDWPDHVCKLKARLNEIKQGFPGINNNHLSLINYGDAKIGDIIIVDLHLFCETTGDEAPLMLRLNETNCTIEGIGAGNDSNDLDRILHRWQDSIPIPPLPKDFLVYRVDVRPTLNGGPGYYYFFKSYRDFRP